MECSLYSPATVDTVSKYLHSRDCTGESSLDQLRHYVIQPVHLAVGVTKLVIDAVKLAFYELCLRFEIPGTDSVHDRAALQTRWSMQADILDVKAACLGLVHLSAGRANRVAAEHFRRQACKLFAADPNGTTKLSNQEIDERLHALYSSGEFRSVIDNRHTTLSHLVGEGVVSGRKNHPRLRIDRFSAHYLRTAPPLDETVDIVSEFLMHRGSSRVLPPLFLNSPMFVEDNNGAMDVPAVLQHHYWTTVARLRIEQAHDAVSDADHRLERVIASVRDNLKGRLKPQWINEKIEAFTRWVKPVNESPIFRKALRLPVLELLASAPDHGASRSVEEAQQERRLREELLEISGNLMAHGVTLRKGGIKNLLNIMLEGFLESAATGPLVDGAYEVCSGPHGPFYVILDNGTGDTDTDYPEWDHMVYLVPNTTHRELAHSVLHRACEKGFLTSRERDVTLTKIVTYSEFLRLDIRGKDGMVDPKKLGVWCSHMKNNEC